MLNGNFEDKYNEDKRKQSVEELFAKIAPIQNNHIKNKLIELASIDPGIFQIYFFYSNFFNFQIFIILDKTGDINEEVGQSKNVRQETKYINIENIKFDKPTAVGPEKFLAIKKVQKYEFQTKGYKYQGQQYYNEKESTTEQRPHVIVLCEENISTPADPNSIVIPCVSKKMIKKWLIMGKKKLAIMLLHKK